MRNFFPYGILFCTAITAAVQAQTFATLVNFRGTNGSNVAAPLVQGSDGNFYGATRLGGASSLGTVFKMTPTGTLTTLANFTGANGSNPNGGMIQTSDGNFYGTTLTGGANNLGTVFRITPTGALTSLYSFGGIDGSSPNAGLIQAADLSLWGTTLTGGLHGFGSVYKISTAGSFTSVYSFNLTDGDAPHGKLLQATDGNFYGTAFAGGANSKGTVFKLTPAGALTTLYNFDVSGAPVNIPDGANPNAGLVQGLDGSLYGTTVSSGGTNNYGTVFRITTTGTFTNLHSFLGDGSGPNSGLLLAADGNLYGTTLTGGASDYGTIFRISQSGAFASLYSFNFADGNTPIGGLAQGKDGNFYGTTSRGGSLGFGTAWVFTPPPPPALTPGLPLPPANAPVISANGTVPVYSSNSTIQSGEWISIFGTDLAASRATWNGNFPTQLAGSSVKINGKSAFLWFVSPGQINAQVPTDTAAGTVQVVVNTAAGTATSTVNLAQFAPSFSRLDGKHVAGIILRANGAYDIIGPAGSSLGYPTVAAKAGDTVSLYGVGFGPTNPAIPAGQLFSGSAPAVNPVQVLINNVSVTPSSAGLSSAGLYQINLTIPANAGTGDVTLKAIVGGVTTPSGIVISLQ